MSPAPAFGNRGERAAVDPPTPAVAAANRTDRGRWKPVECYECVVGISGGFNQKPFAAKCIDVQVGGSKHRFVEVVKHAEWFVKGVGGHKAQTCVLDNVTVLYEIRAKLFNISPDGSSEVEAASGVELTEAEEPTTEKEEEDEDVDPMDALNDLVETPIKRKPAPNRRATIANAKRQTRSAVAAVLMPTRPLCVGSAVADTTTISVYMKGQSQGGSPALRSIYLRMDNLDWLLSYAADQLHHQGIAETAGAEVHNKQANCPAVADLHLDWDFSAKAWLA